MVDFWGKAGLMTYNGLADFILAESLGHPTRIDAVGVERPITCCRHLRQIARARAGLPPCPSGFAGLGQGGWLATARSWGPIARARARYRAWGGRHTAAGAREARARRQRSREARFQRELKSAISFGPGTKQFQFFLKRWPYRKAQIDRVLKARTRLRRGTYPKTVLPKPRYDRYDPKERKRYQKKRTEEDRRRRAWNRKIAERLKRERAKKARALALAKRAARTSRPFVRGDYEGAQVQVTDAPVVLEWRFAPGRKARPPSVSRAATSIARGAAQAAAAMTPWATAQVPPVEYGPAALFK